MSADSVVGKDDASAVADELFEIGNGIFFTVTDLFGGIKYHDIDIFQVCFGRDTDDGGRDSGDVVEYTPCNSTSTSRTARNSAVFETTYLRRISALCFGYVLFVRVLSAT